MKIYLATGNLDKRREMSALLPAYTVAIPSDEGIAFDPVEDGTSFAANSLIKARALFALVHSPVIADDSGICVDALGGAPGIYSARYAGPSAPHGDGHKINQAEQNRMLIEQLNAALAVLPDDKCLDFPNGRRSAHYTCAMTLYLGGDRLFVVQETMEGTIVKSLSDARGTGGFGYDPLFYLPQLGKTSAELSGDEKNAISHRGKACRLIASILPAVLGD